VKGIFIALAIIAGIFIEQQPFAATQYEAENATLSGGANKNTNHAGYSGTGFVDGFFYSTTAQVSFAVNASSAGSSTITLRYSAGNGTSTNTGLYVNGVKIKNITCNATTNWDTWANETETVTLNAGNNTIAYKAEVSSASCINLDYISVQALTQTYALTMSNDGYGTTSPNGTVNVNSGVATSINALPASGYQFLNWTITSGTATIANPSSAGTTVTLTSGNATIRANFTATIPSGTSAVTYAEISSPVSVTAANTVVLALPFTAPSAGYITVTATGLYGTTNSYTDEQRGLESFITLNSTSGGSLSGFGEKSNGPNSAQYVSESAGFQVAAGANTIRLIVTPRATMTATTYKFVKCRMTVVFTQQKM
jgi:hypothetical protein